MGLSLGLGEPEQGLRERACAKLGVAPEELRGFRIARKSLDARRRRGGRAGPGPGERDLRFVIHADLVLPAGTNTARLARLIRKGKVKEAPAMGSLDPHTVHASLGGAGERRAVVVGCGPAGIFAASVLARGGLGVTVLDRGSSLRERAKRLARFHRSRVPDSESNLLFGEGGAGTYSDGKLYTRVDDPLEVPILEELVRCGAPQEILYDSRAHIGTDRLHKILPRLRADLEERGVEFLFNTRLEGLRVSGATGDRDRRVTALVTSAGELPCDVVFLAPGSSARDTWAMLREAGVPFVARPFQMGSRVEHPQELVNRGRYGTGPKVVELLGAASYNLVARGDGGAAACYSFCMCPGGRIVASVSEPGRLCTNGMSNSGHSSRWANGALVVTLGPEVFGPDAFAGVEFQRRLEQAAFEAGGGDYTAPAQRVDDFLAGRETAETGASSYGFGTRPGRIDQLLPPVAAQAMARALLRFDRSIPGFAGPEGLLVGLETRSACPVAIPRDQDSGRAEGFVNLFPVGEGAGHAGGIMSAALDGARIASRLLVAGL
jgi:uncharacterized FAD-dependent dehydrogenase